MQRITGLWKSGTGGKLAIVLGSIITFCCSCLLVGLIVPKPPPTPTPTQTQTSLAVTVDIPTMTSTLTPTYTNTPPSPSPTPSQTPTPTYTPTPTATVVIIIIPPTSSGGSVNYDRNGDGKVTCADFDTQAQAQQAYNAGYKNLDGNDNDGRACESLP